MVRIIDVQTPHVMPLKTLFEILKDFIDDITLQFRYEKKKDKLENGESGKCIRSRTIDPDKNALIDIRLDGEQFTKFVCLNSVYEICLNLPQFNKYSKTLEKDDILSLYIEDATQEQIVMEVENVKKVASKTHIIKLMDPEPMTEITPKTEFDACIKMSSVDFHKLCRDMGHISEYISICCTTKKIEFACQGDISKSTVSFKVDTMGVHIKTTSPNTIVQGIYELKYLISFSKCQGLCENILIYMKNSCPLVIRYTIATLGRVLLCLTPITPKKINDFKEESKQYDDVKPKFKPNIVQKDEEEEEEKQQITIQENDEDKEEPKDKKKKTKDDDEEPKSKDKKTKTKDDDEEPKSKDKKTKIKDDDDEEPKSKDKKKKIKDDDDEEPKSKDKKKKIKDADDDEETKPKDKKKKK